MTSTQPLNSIQVRLNRPLMARPSQERPRPRISQAPAQVKPAPVIRKPAARVDRVA